MTKNYKPIDNGNYECIECGIILSMEDMNNHDDIDCLAHMKMMQNYQYIIG